MLLKRAAKIYRETNMATMPITEYNSRLLLNCLKTVQSCYIDEGNLRNEQIEKAQNILFELMAITNHQLPEGKRLFKLYIYLNQCLVTVRIERETQQLQEVERYLNELIRMWDEVKVKSRTNYQGDGLV